LTIISLLDHPLTARSSLWAVVHLPVEVSSSELASEAAWTRPDQSLRHGQAEYLTLPGGCQKELNTHLAPPKGVQWLLLPPPFSRRDWPTLPPRHLEHSQNLPGSSIRIPAVFIPPSPLPGSLPIVGRVSDFAGLMLVVVSLR